MFHAKETLEALKGGLSPHIGFERDCQTIKMVCQSVISIFINILNKFHGGAKCLGFTFQGQGQTL